MNEKRLEQITVQTQRAPQYLYVQHLLAHLILTTVLVWVLTFHMRNVSRRWVTHWPEMTQPTSACVRDQSLQSFSNSLQPCGLQPARRLCPWDSPGKNPGVASPGDLPNQEVKPASPAAPALQADSLQWSSIQTQAVWLQSICSQLAHCIASSVIRKEEEYT